MAKLYNVSYKRRLKARFDRKNISANAPTTIYLIYVLFVQRLAQEAEQEAAKTNSRMIRAYHITQAKEVEETMGFYKTFPNIVEHVRECSKNSTYHFLVINQTAAKTHNTQANRKEQEKKEEQNFW
ncbi:hypothetical protein EC973_001466 [Apophysomyces ossiformis]|uniref:Transcription factor CBF/NF-Y/archaeal histone domain-containing protein n=1 Tax=Apophysomyces ossiformis TaxID=679940 RepID=A0A8H7BQ14_9FUNG|nr:hypothetical protein EC973_001466 [Apophysomyces ossiformis]